MPVDLSRPRIRITMRALIQKNRIRPRQNRLGNSPAGRGIRVMRMSAEGATDSRDSFAPPGLRSQTTPFHGLRGCCPAGFGEAVCGFSGLERA